MNVHLQGLAFDDLLTAIASWLLAGCAGWAVLICAAALLEAATAGRLRATAWVGCPPSLRRALLAGLGVALVAAPGQATPANASESLGGSAPGWLRSAPERALPSPVRPLGAARAPSGARIVVQPGDTLWHLAGVRLPASASASAVCDLVERLHHRNQEVIGPDPDLIRPGQRLVLPRSPVNARPEFPS